ncbi:MAG: polysaccharide deacetylase, partial [Planctomycetes bacterium]|nr:polysaccharide deacetylase [Planctomycetota bacterium]
MEPSKERLYRVLHRLGAHALVRSFYRAKGAVLMFHRVVADYPRRTFQPGAQFTVTPRVLETIIGALRASGHDLVSLDEMAERLSGPRSSRRFACLTFDDGYRDNLELAYPVCERL